ncbi:MAG: UTP--glucose-1-phosphate uridylyltransferase [Chloroflexi bacterium]|nr:UTP--glucose-1-phosphate uridylyltransferase [Chloroflexota bacterium]
MNVRKAVILAAGYGTRFLPATKAVPKEMLPLVDRPVIQYIVEEALAAGLEQIVMITSAAKRAVEDHFDRDAGLEQALAQKKDEAALREVRRLAGMADIAFVRQKDRRGIAHAVLMARAVVGDEPFALFFPDDVIVSEVPAIRQLLDVQARYGGSVLAVQRLPRQEVVHYGMITPEPVEERVYRVRGILEKPRLEQVTSDLGTVGRYVLAPEIWPLLERTPPGINGEMQLTDTLAMLIAEGHPLYACQYEGERFDTGRPIGLLKASVSLALRREDIGPELKAYLQSLGLR